jgi:hypothetical protein
VAETIFSLITSNPFVTGETIGVSAWINVEDLASEEDLPQGAKAPYNPNPPRYLVRIPAGRRWSR